MSTVTLEFDAYRIYFYTPNKAKSSYGPRKRSVALKNNGVDVGRLEFYPDGYNLPNDFKDPNKNYIVLYFHESDFDRLLDLMRNESPMYLSIRTDSRISVYPGQLGGLGEIRTSMEDVGEEEGV